jgi:2-polyprenyl-3-methyl-5-hydroxy-6-metoxy-1,4-benzoquinol methylase
MNVEYYSSRNSCIACQSNQFVQFYKALKRAILSDSQEMVFDQNLECCYQCGLIRQKNNESYSDNNLRKYYSQTFRTPVNLATLKASDKRVINAKKRRRFIEKIKPTGTLLEIGFGDGVFLDIAAVKYKCTGLDPSSGYKHLHTYLQKKGVEVLDKPLEKYNSPKKYDIVCSFLVLEHVKDPIAFIKRQIDHLANGGILIIEVPDIRKYEFFNSESVLTYEHVYHYCVESLSFLLSQIGLELVSSQNRNVSYGFSLIAAFRKNRAKKQLLTINGFAVMEILQTFIAKRKRYQLGMTKALQSVLKTAKENGQSVAIYGTGFLFNYALETAGLDIEDIHLLFDDTQEKLGKLIFGKKIRSAAEIKTHRPDVVIIFSEMFFDEMARNVLSIYSDKTIEIINIHERSTQQHEHPRAEVAIP